MKSVVLDWSALLLMLVIQLGVLSACPANDWTALTRYQICAVTGSSVVMNCTLTPPAGHTVTKVFWLINAVKGVEPTDVAENPSYTGRVKYFWDENSSKTNCTLRLSDVRMTDGALYRARIIAREEKWQSCSKIQLSVTGLTVWVSEPVVEGREVKLSCKTTCTLTDNPTVIWRKNGADLPVTQTHTSELLLQRVSTEDEGDYSCALKGHEEHPSTPVKLNVTFPPKKTSVSVTPGVITKGTSVTLTCSSDANPPVENYTWFKVNESTPVGSGQQYSITNIRSEDGGQYFCEARNKHGAENSTPVSITINDPVVLYVIAGLSAFGAAGLLCVLVWIRHNRKNRGDKEKAKHNTHSEHPRGVAEDAVQPRHNRQSTEEAEDDVQYTTVQPRHNRQIAGEAEDVQYASVQFKKPEVARSPQGSPDQPEGEHSVIYSSVQRRA